MALTDYVIMPATDYQNICDSVRAKTGKTGLLKSGDVSVEIDSAVGNPVIEALTITENGIYTPSEGVDGYSPITVNVAAAESGADEPYTTVTVTVKKAGVVVAGADTELTKGTVSISGMTDESGVCIFKLPYSVYSTGGSGTWYVYASKDGSDVSSDSAYISFNKYTSSVNLFYATVKINCETDAIVTLVKDGYEQTITATENRATFEVISSGEYTATVTYGEYVLIETITVGTTIGAVYSKNMFATKLSLEEATWDRISALSAEGNPENYFSVGDTKSVYLSGQVGGSLVLDETLYVYILGFNHNAEIEGNGIHFGCFKTASGTDVALVESQYNHNSLSATQPAFSQYDSVNGSTSSYPSNIKENILGDTGVDSLTTPPENTLMAALPSDLRAVLKSMPKYHANSYGAITQLYQYLTIPGIVEVTGSITGGSYSAYSTLSEYTKQYTYYADGASKIKYKHSDSTTACMYWLRDVSTNRDGSTYYGAIGRLFRINVSGSATVGTGQYQNYNSLGIAPIFMV